METNTKLMDSIYFYNGTTLTVNLFMPSVLTWTAARHHGHPDHHATRSATPPRCTVTGSVSGSWTMRIRIPAWTTGATISVNGVAQNITTTPGSYATLTRSWASGDTVTVRLPMRVVMQAANDNANVAAVTYGPVVLSGNYGNTTLSRAARADHVARSPGPAPARWRSPPPPTGRRSTSARSTTRTATTTPSTGTPPAAAAPAAPATGWSTRPAAWCSASRTCPPPTAGSPLQWGDTGTADHNWELIVDGTRGPAPQRQQRQGPRRGEHVHRRQRPRPAVGRQRHRRPPLDARRQRRRHPQDPQRQQRQAAGHPQRLHRQRRAGRAGPGQRQRRTTSGGSCPTAPAASRTSPAAWSSACRTCPPPTAAWSSSGATPAPPTTCGPPSSTPAATSGCATPTAARCSAWRTRPPPTAPASCSGPTTAPPTTGGGCATARNGYFRIQCANGGRVLGVSGASTAQGAQVVIWDDNGTNDHLWRFI